MIHKTPSSLFFLNIFMLPFACLIIYIQDNSSNNIFADFLHIQLTTIFCILLFINSIHLVWAGYGYMNGPTPRDSEQSQENIIRIVGSLLWPIFILVVIRKLIYARSPSALVKYLLLNEEQLGLLCDAKAKWKDSNLNLWQVRMKETMFLLELCWGGFICWCNHENKKTRS